MDFKEIANRELLLAAVSKFNSTVKDLDLITIIVNKK